MSVIIVNVWRGVPFYAISLLAGLQTINPELQEAAAIDGARPWQRFWHVTWPLLLPVTMVVVLFSVIQTFADFQLVYVLTGGGPANATQLFATYAYQIGVGTGLLSQGAAISLAMFPVLLLVVIVQLLYIRRVEVALSHDRRSEVAALGLLLHPARRVRLLAAVPVLLDAGDDFRPDNELYRPWMAPNYTPFWTAHPTLDHIRYLLDETLFSAWMLNTLLISHGRDA